MACHIEEKNLCSVCDEKKLTFLKNNLDLFI